MQTHLLDLGGNLPDCVVYIYIYSNIIYIYIYYANTPP